MEAVHSWCFLWICLYNLTMQVLAGSACNTFLFNLTLNKLKMKACLIIYIWDQFMIFVVSPPPSLWMKNLTRSQLHHSARIDTVTCDGESRRRPPVSPPRWPSLSPPWWPSFSQYKSRATFCDGESNGNSRRQPPQQARSQPALPAPFTIGTIEIKSNVEIVIS